MKIRVLVSENNQINEVFKGLLVPVLAYILDLPPSDGNSGIFCRYQPYEVEDVNGKVYRDLVLAQY